MAAATASEAVRPTPDRRETALAINDLDLVFVMDTTGSMRNELADVQANLLGVIRVLARLAPSLRVGFVAFKDHGAAYVTQSFRLSPMSQDNVAEGDPVRRRDVGRGRRRRSRARRRGAGGRDGDGLARRCPGPDRRDRRRAGPACGPGDARWRWPSGSGARRRTLPCRARYRPSLPAQGPAARIFFEQIARAGGGDFSAYEGQIIENVLLSVLRDPGELASR